MDDQQREPKRRLDLDVRGLLAILSVSYVFILAITQMVIGFVRGVPISSLKDLADIPAWAVGVTMGVLGYYFGGHSSSNGKHKE